MYRRISVCRIRCHSWFRASTGGGGVLEHIPVDEGGTLCETRVSCSRNDRGQYTLTAVIPRLAGGVDPFPACHCAEDKPDPLYLSVAQGGFMSASPPYSATFLKTFQFKSQNPLLKKEVLLAGDLLPGQRCADTRGLLHLPSACR